MFKRVFKIDMVPCPNCGGELKIIAAILEQSIIYSDRLIETSPKTGITVVPVDRATPIPVR